MNFTRKKRRFYKKYYWRLANRQKEGRLPKKSPPCAAEGTRTPTP